ncbi:MAG: response regulator [Verrucomicrobia bacterium]|nr:response regulator [Verrucomicrobiota bacterium]
MSKPEPIAGENSLIVVPDILSGSDSFLRAKILIVAQERSTVQLLERILQRVRIQNFRSTTDSPAALSLFREFWPDLVLIDWMMADVNGRPMVEQLRAMIPDGAFVPIVVLLWDATSEARQLALASGANELISKPIDACEVVLRIANMARVRLAYLRLEEQKRALQGTVLQRTLDLNRALEALRASEESVAQSERLSAVGTMVSGIAHDFNNALTLIMGSGEILLTDAEHEHLTKENTIQMLKDILTAARGAAELVSDLRKFSKAGDTADAQQPVDLNSLVKRAIALSKTKWDSQAFGEGSQIRVAVDLQEIPVIQGNAVRLRDAITNLIFNAVDAMPNGGTLTLRTRTKDQVILVEVADTGIGMTEEVRRSCFDPFFTTKGQKGTGLGLAMVYGIVRHHSGTIDIATEPGKGTTFILKLPIPPAA